MDDTQSILATGGMGGATTIVLFLVYKLLRQGIRSRCCGREVEVGLVTPKNIVIVDAEQRPAPSQADPDAHLQRPSGGSSLQDTSREDTSKAEESKERGDRSRDHFETTNPLSISVPKSL